MPEYITKRLNVTFKTGLPMGERANFTYQGELWVGLPARKYTRIVAVLDRIIGIHVSMQREMIRWINARPQDAELVVRVLDRLARSRQLHSEIINDKVRTQIA